MPPIRASHLGRFISEDPIGFRGGINLFAYVNNNPSHWTDPLGRQGNIPDPNNPPADWKPVGSDRWVDPNGDSWRWHPDPNGDHGGDHWDIGGPKGSNGEKGKQEWWPNRPGGQREPKPAGKDRFDILDDDISFGESCPILDPSTFPTSSPGTMSPQAAGAAVGTTVVIIVIIILLPVGA